ncbi:MAG: 30S ribosomal protein S21 [Candidatus Nanoarchaeia archaeon]|jgi:small subunit ribosomal protein S21|nr:30S ribosomal protein S21 [Candidatus Nanoarchaeia archaeon]
MNGIYIRETEIFEKALRRFIKTCERAGVLSELKSYRHYEKPSETRKRKMNIAKRRKLREEREQREPRRRRY